MAAELSLLVSGEGDFDHWNALDNQCRDLRQWARPGCGMRPKVAYCAAMAPLYVLYAWLWMTSFPGALDRDCRRLFGHSFDDLWTEVRAAVWEWAQARSAS